MKTAISLPDELFRRADALAHAEQKSRSQVYAEALRAWLARREADGVTAALDRVEAACADDEAVAWAALGADAVGRSEWSP